MKKNSSITKLNLQHNSFGVGGLETIINAAKSSVSLLSLQCYGVCSERPSIVKAMEKLFEGSGVLFVSFFLTSSRERVVDFFLFWLCIKRTR